MFLYTKCGNGANSSSRVLEIPSDFDPERFPILARHYFGEPANDHAASASTAPVLDFNLIRLAAELRRLGVGVGVDVGTKSDVLARLDQQTTSHIDALAASGETELRRRQFAAPDGEHVEKIPQVETGTKTRDVPQPLAQLDELVRAEVRAVWWRQLRLGHRLPAEHGVIVIRGERP